MIRLRIGITPPQLVAGFLPGIIAVPAASVKQVRCCARSPLEVDVPRSWLRRSRKGLWYCTRDIPPDRIRRLFGFVELARAAG
jgi:hypothetical protein